MNYIGSKFKLSSWLDEEIRKVVGNDLSDKVFCDIFAGTGIVGRTFKPHVKKVIANDLEYYSYVLNRNYIGNHEKIKNQEELIEELNNLPLKRDLSIKIIAGAEEVIDSILKMKMAKELILFAKK